MIGFSQAPNLFSYQSIARNATGNVLISSPVSIRINIHDLTPTGALVFQETQFVTTNEFGLFTLNIGGGTPALGSIATVDWANGSKYVEIEADLTGGVAYADYGTTELLSVPYAIYAGTAGIPLLPNGTANGNTTYWNGLNWVVDEDNLYHNGNRIGIANTSPLQRLDIFGNMNISLDSSYMIDNKRVLGTRGTKNVFVGDSAGFVNTIGFTNAFMGYTAGRSNSVGSQNTFVGAESGYANLNGFMNTFMGRRAGFQNNDGDENTFIGAYAGQSNSSGEHNSFFGVTTGNSNSTGSENTYLGAHAGYFSSTGSFNTFVGNFAAITNSGGNFNTIVGFEADLASGSYNNASAFGYQAVANSSNSVMVGNSAVTFIGGQVGWSTISDGRLKKKVRKNELGLEFINRLETVSYEYKAKGQRGTRYSGLIAQDVESILVDMKKDFSGVVKPQSEEDHYSIRYSEFVIPLIKSVQEQSQEIKDLKEKNADLEQRLLELEGKMNKILQTN